MRDFAINSEGFHLFTFLLSKITQPCPHCSGNNGGGECYVMILRNILLRHSGPIFSESVNWLRKSSSSNWWLEGL